MVSHAPYNPYYWRYSPIHRSQYASSQIQFGRTPFLCVSICVVVAAAAAVDIHVWIRINYRFVILGEDRIDPKVQRHFHHYFGKDKNVCTQHSRQRQRQGQTNENTLSNRFLFLPLFLPLWSCTNHTIRIDIMCTNSPVAKSNATNQLK